MGLMNLFKKVIFGQVIIPAKGIFLMAQNSNEMGKCEKLKEFLTCQQDIIKRHIDEHLWFQHIPEKEKGIADFIQKYGWLMRELFCLHSCENKDKCDLIKLSVKKKGK